MAGLAEIIPSHKTNTTTLTEEAPLHRKGLQQARQAGIPMPELQVRHHHLPIGQAEQATLHLVITHHLIQGVIPATAAQEAVLHILLLAEALQVLVEEAATHQAAMEDHHIHLLADRQAAEVHPGDLLLLQDRQEVVEGNK
jgi:hypothetical protein